MKMTNKKVLAATTALASILSAKTSARMNPNLKTCLIVSGSTLFGLELINEGLGIFGPATKWYNGGWSLYHNILGKKEKKPDDKKENKDNKDSEKINSKLTEEQNVALNIFLKKFNGTKTSSGKILDFYDKSDTEMQNLKKNLETIFSKVVKGEYAEGPTLSEYHRKVQGMILNWIEGRQEFNMRVGNVLEKLFQAFIFVKENDNKIDGSVTFTINSDSKRASFIFESKVLIGVEL